MLNATQHQGEGRSPWWCNALAICRRGPLLPPLPVERLAAQNKQLREALAYVLCVLFPHPRCAVIDHIVPVAKGGEHVRSNVQCAHNDCNNRRGSVGSAQMLLFG